MEMASRASPPGRTDPMPRGDPFSLRPHHSLSAIRFRARIGHMIALPVEANDEHRASMAIAIRLVRSKSRRIAAFRRNVSDALPETTVAETVRAAKKFDAVVGIIRSECWLHGAKVLVAKGQKVRPHAKRV